MKKSFKKFLKVRKYNGYTIMVYGERWEEGYIDGMIIQRAKFSKDGRKVMDLSTDHEEILLNRPYTRTRYFNMGWAICSPEDKFDETVGIELCKKRFRKSPLKTETGLFLTEDMINALLENEINYIEKNWSKFVHSNENTQNENDEQVKSEFEKTNNCEEKVEKKVNDDGTNVEPGMHVRLLGEDDGRVTIAHVKDVDDKNIYFSWIAKYGHGFFSFNYSNGAASLSVPKDTKLRKAKEYEVVTALKIIENNTTVKWDGRKRPFRF